MFPNAEWLKALDVKGSSALAVGVVCFVVFGFAEQGWFYFDTFPGYVRAIFFTVGLLGVAIAIANLVQHIIKKGGERKAARAAAAEKAAFQACVIKGLDSLDEDEKAIITFLVTDNRKSFSTTVTHGPTGQLVQKGLLLPANGVHSGVAWPHTVPEFVWDELQKRKAEFTTKKK